MIAIKKEEFPEERIVNQIRSLGLDMIDKAGSGHPGIVLGAAPILYSLYANHMKIHPDDPTWINRDRFVMSAGHGSALLYATLYMAGYSLSLEDLMAFRQIDSITPGHPEVLVTPGVDMSTGPLGQGLASAVGMAMAERYLANLYNKKQEDLIDYYTYVLCGDGDLMEGISYEAMSLAGTMKLHKLIVLYDSNGISLDGTTSLAFTDDIESRVSSCGWNYITTNDDPVNIDKAILKAKQCLDKPTLIQVKTTIGKFSKWQGTNKVHGTVLEKEDISEIKKKLDVRDIPFTISQEVVDAMQDKIKVRLSNTYETWMENFEQLDNLLKNELEALVDPTKREGMPEIALSIPEERSESPRVTSSSILNQVASNLPHMLVGSADVSSSTKTYLKDLGDFGRENYLGKNIWFGVREHAMGAILNGLALSGLRPVGSTFLSFSDYMKPAIRMACFMDLPVIYVFTHDSVSVGEDGPTHQPVEQLVTLRSIPNMEVFRPADANEVLGTYKYALAKQTGPTAIVLSRNVLPIEESTSVNDVSKGAYILRDGRKGVDAVLI